MQIIVTQPVFWKEPKTNVIQYRHWKSAKGFVAITCYFNSLN